jgi:hypothetical protein
MKKPSRRRVRRIRRRAILSAYRMLKKLVKQGRLADKNYLYINLDRGHHLVESVHIAARLLSFKNKDITINEDEGICKIIKF